MILSKLEFRVTSDNKHQVLNFDEDYPGTQIVFHGEFTIRSLAARMPGVCFKFGETIDLMEFGNKRKPLLESQIGERTLRIENNIRITWICVRNKATREIEFFDGLKDTNAFQYQTNLAKNTLSFHGTIGPVDIISNLQQNLGLITTSAQETDLYRPLGYSLNVFCSPMRD